MYKSLLGSKRLDTCNSFTNSYCGRKQCKATQRLRLVPKIIGAKDHLGRSLNWNFSEKPRKAKNFVKICLHYFCPIHSVHVKFCHHGKQKNLNVTNIREVLFKSMIKVGWKPKLHVYQNPSIAANIHSNKLFISQVVFLFSFQVSLEALQYHNSAPHTTPKISSACDFHSKSYHHDRPLGAMFFFVFVFFVMITLSTVRIVTVFSPLKEDHIK